MDSSQPIVPNNNPQSNPFAGLLGLKTNDQPSRKSRIAYYQKEYFERRGALAEYNARLAALTREWKETTAEEKVEQGLPAELPHPVTLRRKVAIEYLDAESDEFVKTLDIEIQTQYDESMAEWRKGCTKSTTPAEYH